MGKTTVLSTYNIQATYVNPTILRINFPTNSRSSSGNTWGNGFYISLSYDAKHFGDSLVMIIYNDVCYSCNASTLACTNTLTKHTGRFSTMKIFHNNSIYSKWILFKKNDVKMISPIFMLVCLSRCEPESQSNTKSKETKYRWRE